MFAIRVDQCRYINQSITNMTNTFQRHATTKFSRQYTNYTPSKYNHNIYADEKSCFIQPHQIREHVNINLCRHLSSKICREDGSKMLLFQEKMFYDSTKKDIKTLLSEIQTELGNSCKNLEKISIACFDGYGKAMRPFICLHMSQAINQHQGITKVLQSQKIVAKFAEMLHTATLLHDDVIDCSNMRRGKEAIHSKYTNKQSIMTGNYILSVASAMLTRTDNSKVIEVLSQSLDDIVQGELMQTITTEKEEDRFFQYINKSYNKTASLIANSCKAVAILAVAEDDDEKKEILDAAFQYGKNIGIAFQLIDDLLDYTSASDVLGKPNLNDIKSGLATAPVLFTALKFPEINELIDRRFKNAGDIDYVMDLISKSDSFEETKQLARQHCQDAIKHISILKPSVSRQAFINLTNDILNRKK